MTTKGTCNQLEWLHFEKLIHLCCIFVKLNMFVERSGGIFNLNFIFLVHNTRAVKNHFEITMLLKCSSSILASERAWHGASDTRYYSIFCHLNLFTREKLGVGSWNCFLCRQTFEQETKLETSPPQHNNNEQPKKRWTRKLMSWCSG